MKNDQTAGQPADQHTASNGQRRIVLQANRFTKKRLQETEARAFWNRRALTAEQPERKAA